MRDNLILAGIALVGLLAAAFALGAQCSTDTDRICLADRCRECDRYEGVWICQ